MDAPVYEIDIELAHRQTVTVPAWALEWIESEAHAADAELYVLCPATPAAWRHASSVSDGSGNAIPSVRFNASTSVRFEPDDPVEIMVEYDRPNRPAIRARTVRPSYRYATEPKAIYRSA